MGSARRETPTSSGADLAYWDVTRHAWALERGTVERMVGNWSADAALTLKTTVAITP
jgi:hypothetical protein